MSVAKLTDVANTWRTKDAFLVSWLRYNRHVPFEVYVDDANEHDASDTVYWEFHKTPKLMDDVLKYLEDSGQVEPKKFANIIFSTRKEMFKVLNGDTEPTTP